MISERYSEEYSEKTPEYGEGGSSAATICPVFITFFDSQTPEYWRCYQVISGRMADFAAVSACDADCSPRSAFWISRPMASVMAM